MKTYFQITLGIMLLTGVLTAGAQAQSSQRIIASIPFSFTVGKTNLPAGRYTITVLNPSSDQKTLQIRSLDGHSSAVVLTTGVIGAASDNAKLVFDRYDDRYYFAKAQMAGDSTSLALHNKADRWKAGIARSGKKSVVVIVAE
jgi:hypothetical protein